MTPGGSSLVHIAILLHVALAVVSAAGSPVVPQQSGINAVAWMHGCWESASPQRIVEEQWTAPRAGSMLGVGRTSRGERLVEYEFVLLQEHEGRLAYEAHPSGQPSAVFTSSTISDTMAVFENPEHDFPQRVGYRKEGPDAMVAWVEGTENGKQRRVEFPYRRVPCR
jgi:Domain of unknown function (DUF6265)